ncbi:hypothetical protein Hanom_Chr11g00982461 [Helianthus anomalus]
MGSSKLKVNVARFASENASFLATMNMAGGSNLEELAGKNHVQHQRNNQAFIKDGGGKLFSDLFPKDYGVKAGNSSAQVSKGKMVEALEQTTTFQELNGKAVVGRCLNLLTMNNLFSHMTKAGVLDFSLSYLGGLYMLVKFSSTENCNELVCNHGVWSQWFSSFDHWISQSPAFEKIAWLKVVGVPIHLLVDEVYDSIAKNFGKIIHASQRSSEDNDLSVNCIGVLTGVGTRIAEEVTLKWKDKLFKVWVEEETTGWVPECLKEDGYSEDERSSQFRFDDRENDQSSDRKESPEKSVRGTSVEAQKVLNVHGDVPVPEEPCSAHVVNVPKDYNDVSVPMQKGGEFSEAGGEEFLSSHMQGRLGCSPLNPVGGENSGGPTCQVLMWVALKIKGRDLKSPRY